MREIEAILPIADGLVREVGDIPDVMSGFLTLCERAVEHYPAATFVEQVTVAMSRQERTPVGWRSLMIPSRIAVNYYDQYDVRACCQIKLTQYRLPLGCFFAACAGCFGSPGAALLGMPDNIAKPPATIELTHYH
jgi:hypothetical protein